MLECRFKGWCRIEYDADFDVCYPCVGDGAETCIEYEPMPDVEALLKLAEEIDSIASFAEEAGRASVSMGTGSLMEIERRIREAVGA